MAAVDCMSMASRHHPHHPHNHQHGRDRRSSYSTLGSNNPYARYMSPAPSAHSHSHSHSRSKRSLSESFPSVPTVSMDSLWWSGSPEHQPVHPRFQRESSGTQRRHSHQRYSRNSQLVNPDIIDELDDVTSYSYHHEGPYDAVCPERNRVSHHSPLEAPSPARWHGLFPPGATDRDGQTYEYEEGSNMMDEYGLFMRLPGQKFTDEDFKNDPFYNRPISNPFLQLKKKLSLRRNKKRRSTA
ncbi:uncharacterized protein N7458_004969 [Penicillium daleae]|uniref:Uncharacterized protein n=1 Tax=Penicillium daleae TaxID=63821 RepID=A0AAD6G3F0_9EURO|nr:uncharacterized protein N7458_004969 [Penicillium daleae]KAJ5454013.1 hypothetical protein N7458_004969 [Penicillium daleae]